MRQDVIDYVKERAASQEMMGYFSGTLLEMLLIDNTPRDKLEPEMPSEERVSQLRQAEAGVFDIIQRELEDIFKTGIDIARVPINPAIEQHPAYTRSHYTVSSEHPHGLSFAETYDGRANLVARVRGANPGEGKSVIFNCHVDTVNPHLEVRVTGQGRLDASVVGIGGAGEEVSVFANAGVDANGDGTLAMLVGPADAYDGETETAIYGRGACDDKGQAALLLTQLKILKDVEREFGISVLGDMVYQFVIDEETGGNGSLSLVVDPPYADIRDVVVCEITDNNVHPANRGALWYEVNVNGSGYDIDTVDLGFRIVMALEKNGLEMIEETRQAIDDGDYTLFKVEHEQTCQGVFGVFGEHASTVNDYVALDVSVEHLGDVQSAIDRGLQAYFAVYGDKKEELELEAHYKLAEADHGYKLEVFGKSGHMGKVWELDDAIVKAAYINEELRKLDGVVVGLVGGESCASSLTIEGGQGFIPLHPIADLKPRIDDAVQSAVIEYCAENGVGYNDGMVETSYDALHNDACQSPVDSLPMQAMQTTFGQLEQEWEDPTAWRVSCDLRLFAGEGYNGLVTGPGSLNYAHSDGEHITFSDVQTALPRFVLFAMNMCGYSE